ncbi:MAG: hypothetical protein AB7I41_04600 [Candidatus Sericytochromatia bacterium]
MQLSQIPPFPSKLQIALQTLLSELEAPWPTFADPYWPKWDHLWWKLTFLLETGQIQKLSPGVFARFAELLAGHYLPFFPLIESELPVGIDPYRHILCHCALGTAMQILQAGGRDPWQDWPWLAEWLSRYQLPDGGYNCDEAVYTHSHRSSVVSSLPVLEALLQKPVLSSAEQNSLRQGAESLLKRRLFQSSQGKVIDPLWLQPLFPRFYNYDLLRALHFVCSWALTCREPLTQEALTPALNTLRNQVKSTGLQAQTWYPALEKTLRPVSNTGEWERGQASDLFPLLAAFISENHAQVYIQQEWQEIEAMIQHLQKMGLFV